MDKKIKDWSEFLKDIPTEVLQREIELRKEENVNWYKLLTAGTINQISFNIMTDIDDALSKFGHYTFSDKGCDEVMYLGKFDEQLESMSIPDIAKVLSDVLDYYELGSNQKGKLRYAQEVVTGLIGNLDERDDFDDLFELDSRFGY